MRVTKTHEAERDLDEIWLYIADDNIDAADALIDEITRLSTLLATQPLMGRDRADLAPQLRSISVGSYVLFYTAMSDGIEVTRVLHGGRDLPEIFARH